MVEMRLKRKVVALVFFTALFSPLLMVLTALALKTLFPPQDPLDWMGLIGASLFLDGLFITLTTGLFFADILSVVSKRTLRLEELSAELQEKAWGLLEWHEEGREERQKSFNGGMAEIISLMREMIVKVRTQKESSSAQASAELSNQLALSVKALGRLVEENRAMALRQGSPSGFKDLLALQSNLSNEVRELRQLLEDRSQAPAPKNVLAFPVEKKKTYFRRETPLTSKAAS